MPLSTTLEGERAMSFKILATQKSPVREDNLLNRCVLPDGTSTILKVDYSEDLTFVHTFFNKTSNGLFGLNKPREESGTGANALDANGQLIACTITRLGKVVTYTFASPPPVQNNALGCFNVWASFLFPSD